MRRVRGDKRVQKKEAGARISFGVPANSLALVLKVRVGLFAILSFVFMHKRFVVLQRKKWSLKEHSFFLIFSFMLELFSPKVNIYANVRLWINKLKMYVENDVEDIKQGYS